MTLIGICKLLRRSEDRPSVHTLVATASVSWWVMLIVFLQQEIDVFKDQSLHFPHDMRGNAAIPPKAHCRSRYCRSDTQASSVLVREVT